LKRVLIDTGLKLGDVDGKADIWTMSPPCQPYTTTHGARRRDALDNRSRGIFWLMELLLGMRRGLPRWIVLENVRGFINSSVLQLWKRVVTACGYLYRQYELSPDTCVGLPNSRRRYYFIAEHRDSDHAANLVQLSVSNLVSTSIPVPQGEEQEVGGGVSTMDTVVTPTSAST
jgi:site-specific DNA-cytosine methylase